jgi:hypothetical protein
MEDPPSVMEINVYDFDGPFDEVACLGHAEVNFLKYNISELAEIWISLKGKLAQACQSKLHLRIFLNNTRGTQVVKDYLDKMEKEVGKKVRSSCVIKCKYYPILSLLTYRTFILQIAVRSPHANLAFQKIFSLPAEEFLINDFTCHLKRKMLTQVYVYSLRLIAFFAALLLVYVSLHPFYSTSVIKVIRFSHLDCYTRGLQIYR